MIWYAEIDERKDSAPLRRQLCQEFSVSRKQQPSLPVGSTSVPEAAGHFVYLLSCADGTLYTGYTTNVARRLAMHNAGKGARYTRARRPVTLLICWTYATKSEALRAELAMKALPRAEKLRLAQVQAASEASLY